jgi:hypothetical protein
MIQTRPANTNYFLLWKWQVLESQMHHKKSTNIWKQRDIKKQIVLIFGSGQKWALGHLKICTTFLSSCQENEEET